MIHEYLVNVPPQLREVVLVDPSAPLPSVPSRATAPDESPKECQACKADHETLLAVLNSLSEVATDLETQQSQRLQEMQQVAVELAMAVASRLAHEQLEAGNLGVESLVRQAVERLKTTEPVTVFLHPKDLELLKTRLAKVQPRPADLAKLRLAADPQLARGNCRAEAGDTSVVLDVQEQLSAIRRHLLDALPEAVLDRRRQQAAENALKRFPDRRHTA
jgi:flagellar biosynthesis/type III secretory pathway protein FliH